MDCRELVELVTEYFEGALPEERARLVREHLDQCVDCLRYLGQIQLTVQLLSRLTVKETSL